MVKAAKHIKLNNRSLHQQISLLRRCGQTFHTQHVCLQAYRRVDSSHGLRHAGGRLHTGRRKAKVQGHLRHPHDLGQQRGWFVQCSH